MSIRDIHFGAGGRSYRLDLDGGHLVRELDELVPLVRKQWDLLHFFVTHPGRLVTKDTLLESVWGKDIAITDDAVGHAVRSLRRALDDDSKRPLFIETVHGRGYRFIAEVSKQPEHSNHARSGGIETKRLVVLFVDDEPWSVQAYVDALRRDDWVVVLKETAESGLEFLQSGERIDYVLLDVMMPMPVITDTVDDELRTGVRLLDQCRSIIAGRRLPVSLLTNRRPLIVSEEIRRLSLPAGLVELRPKIENPPFHLPKAMRDHLARTRETWTGSSNE